MILIESGFAWMLLTTVPGKQMIGCICLGRHRIVFAVPTMGPHIQHRCNLENAMTPDAFITHYSFTGMTQTNARDFPLTTRTARPNEQRESQRIHGIAGAHTPSTTASERMVNDRPNERAGATNNFWQHKDTAPLASSLPPSPSLSLSHDPTIEVHRHYRLEAVNLTHRCRRDQYVWS